MKLEALFVVTAMLVGGCATHRPVIVDVRCPRNTTMIFAGDDGRCIAPDGKNHGPSWTASERGVSVDNYDHGTLAGPYEQFNARGKLVAHGYKPGVTDSTEPAPGELGEVEWDSPKTSGRLVWPERVRLFPIQGDVAFAASTLIAPEGKPSSSFLGASMQIGFPARERMRYRGDAYRAFYVSYGVQGAAGIVARAECDVAGVSGSGGFCGSRWMLGPYIRIGYARSHDANASASVPSLLGYGRLGFLFGEDQWRSTASSGSALVWRLRAGGGWTSLGALFSVVRSAKYAPPREAWRWLLVPLAFVLEHAEGYVELGGDGTSVLGVGAGVDIGVGL